MSHLCLRVNPTKVPCAAASLALSVVFKDHVNVEFVNDLPHDAVLFNGSDSSPIASGDFQVALHLARSIPSANLDVSDELKNKWITHFTTIQSSKDAKTLMEILSNLNQSLMLNTFLSGNENVSVLDVLLWSSLKCNPVWNKNYKDKKDLASNVTRLFKYVSDLDFVTQSALIMQQAVVSSKVQSDKKAIEAKDQASYEINLEGATMGNVVTRFPPEPSGYLHIGHAKAAMLNQYFADKYNGKLIFRFDDTNPDKETSEYEESIFEDLKTLGIKWDVLTRTSDYFDLIKEFAVKMINEGKAYCDDTPTEAMREQRAQGIESACRSNTVEENLHRFAEMEKGTEFGLTNCLRAKIGMHHLNKAMRDPVMYRCNLNPHHSTGSKYRIYPTYDFACPIVDSVEGVTHALRTTEYHDRNDQYYWFIEALGIRRPFIYDYSRLNFTYTLLSKRKLKWFVENGRVSGWDDPRFPTVRGMLRRGLSVEALREYILMQGPSKNTVLLEWDKLWAVNKKVIDPISPRFSVLLKEEPLCTVYIEGGPKQAEQRTILKHKKNESLGSKNVWYSDEILLEQSDVFDSHEGEEFTLMDWGNVIVQQVTKRPQDGKVVSLHVRLHLEGDFKKTKKKLTWISNKPAENIVPVHLLNYGYLISKKKLEENDKLEDFINPTTETQQIAIGDQNLLSIKRGDFIQIERKGFYICDSDSTSSLTSQIHLILVPDGKAKLPGMQ